MTGFFIGLAIGLVGGPFGWEGIKWCYRKVKERLAPKK